MSKTVPMWAAVMNRAVLRLRQAAAAHQVAQQAAQQPGGSGPSTAEAAAADAAAAEAAAEAEWDCGVHLPAWVSDHEANTVRQRLEGWVDQLLEVRRAVWL